MEDIGKICPLYLAPDLLYRLQQILPVPLEQLGNICDLSKTKKKLKSLEQFVFFKSDNIDIPELKLKLQDAVSKLTSKGFFLLTVKMKNKADYEYLGGLFRKHGFVIHSSCVDKKSPDNPEIAYVLEKVESEAQTIVEPTVNNECTKDTVVCSAQKGEALPICCYNHIKEMILFTIDLFEKNNITYWLDYGTLLGAARTGKLIPWDSDGDIGVFAKDYDKIRRLQSYFLIGGYYLDLERVTNHSVMRLYYSKKNLRRVDIYLWSKEFKDMVRHDFKKPFVGRKFRFPASNVETLGEVIFYDKKVKCPSNKEQFLELRYGPNWETPCNSGGEIDTIEGYADEDIQDTETKT